MSERSGAEFSPCRTWRYALWREWDLGKLYVAFIGLNPSTADESEDDPTIRRCVGFARAWGYGGIYMLNLFAFRATDPEVCRAARDPIGPDNDQAILRYTSVPACRLIVAAWGAGIVAHRKHRPRDWQVKNLLKGRELKCLGLTSTGQPRHPLYVRGDAELVNLQPA